MKKLSLFIIALVCISCSKKAPVDSIIINAKVYTVNEQFELATAFAVTEGKIIAVGNSNDIQEKYTSENIIDANNKTIYPGFIDAHCHFYGLGMAEQSVKLEGTKSFAEVVHRIVDFQNEKNLQFITGRGWDQNDWELKEFPTKDTLDLLFPNTPIAVRRVDGHAMLINQAAMDLANITDKSFVEGGEFIKKNGKLTGVLLDNAMGLVWDVQPKPSKSEMIFALKDAEKICFNLGLTTVDEAGLDRDVIELIDSLQTTGDLKMRVYAMIATSENNLNYYLNKGITKTDKLNVRSFKFVGDGALGSRGATLRKPYSDRPGHYGTLSNSIDFLNSTAKKIAASEFQMNTHAIGDSSNHATLAIYKKVLKGKKDRRWRIEHAQILAAEDFNAFDNIIPSVQPTHATSDMYWAEDRVGSDRIKKSYAYKDLLNKYGKVALGTDFPVEKVSPFLTFYAAVARQDTEGYPKGGFQMENALTREETLKGMTIWAAYANFEEHEKGSIEVGKFADFIILDQDIMEVDISKVPDTKVIGTYIDGVKVN